MVSNLITISGDDVKKAQCFQKDVHDGYGIVTWSYFYWQYQLYIYVWSLTCQGTLLDVAAAVFDSEPSFISMK